MKLKRLVSAVLAVGMALTIFPTAAFAADTATTPVDDGYVKNLKFDIEGRPDLSNSKPKDPNDPHTSYSPNESNSHWGWSYSGGSYKLDIAGIYDPAHGVPETIPCAARNTGTIQGGNFQKSVISTAGTVEGGNFYYLEARGTSVINGGYIREYLSNGASAVDWAGKDKVLDGAIVYEKTTFYRDYGKITSGIISNICNNGEDTPFVDDYQTFTAQGCTIIPVVNGTPIDNAPFQGKAYLIGDNSSNIKTRTFIIVPITKEFYGWDETGANGAVIQPCTIEPYASNNALMVTLPDNATSAGDVTIKANIDPTPVTIGKVDGNVVPVDKDGEFHAGGDFDGWYYNKDTDTLTVYKNGKINLGNSEVNWKIDNYGVIEGGIFTCNDELNDILVNEEGGQILGGTFNTVVSNYGTIDNGTFNKKVNNYSVVNNGIFTDRYSNSPTTDRLPDATIVLSSVGVTKGGIFSHSADFYNQKDLKISWIALNNCTANGISNMVGIVGNQTLTIEADTACTGWEFSTDADYEETVAKQVPTDNKDTFTLTLNGDDERNITLTALLKEGYYRMNLVDGTATVNDKEATSAKVGDTVKLTAADAPDGMVFDRWEITPTDASLNLEGFDANAATTSFVMPAQTLTIRAMYRMADVEEPNVLGTAAVIGTVAVGGAVIAWQGYNIAADIYARDILPEGTAIPETKEALAVMLWQNAGKPEVVAADGSALSETEQAQQWVVANGLMENEADGTFHPEKGVGKFAALNAIKAQSEAKVNE